MYLHIISLNAVGKFFSLGLRSSVEPVGVVGEARLGLFPDVLSVALGLFHCGVMIPFTSRNSRPVFVDSQ